jgi:hypothetical protein
MFSGKYGETPRAEVLVDAKAATKAKLETVADFNSTPPALRALALEQICKGRDTCLAV